MRKLFAVLVSIVVLGVFSSVALAQSAPASSKKTKVVERGKTKTKAVSQKKAPTVQQKRIAMSSKKPLTKKSAAKPVTLQKAKVKTAAKRKAERSFFGSVMLTPIVMMIWVPLLLAVIVIVIQAFRLFPRREPEEMDVPEETEESLPSWDQKLWSRIKEVVGRIRKKPAMAPC